MTVHPETLERDAEAQATQRNSEVVNALLPPPTQYGQPYSVTVYPSAFGYAYDSGDMDGDE